MDGGTSNVDRASTRDAARETTEQETFRAWCRAWLREHMPARPSFHLPQGPLEISTEAQLEYLCAWQKSAYQAGLVGCDYPREYGGRGRRDCQRIANEELQTAGAPFLPNLVGLGMAGPTILHHGTQAQKERLLPPLLSGDEIWCQGFSEPGAGSDLANVQAYAERRGDQWVINGHKVWTTLAHFATWMILLCRTDKADKYRGLTYFAVPIKAAVGKGVEVRPLVKMTGEAGFNEVLFEDLVVGDDCRLDEVGRGWAVAMTTLMHERGAGTLVTPSSGSSGGDELGPDGLVELAWRSRRGGRPAAEDPLVRDGIVRLLMRRRAFEQSRRRASVPALVDHPQRLPLQHKLVLSEMLQDTARLACEIEGMGSTLVRTDEHAPAEGRWPLAYMNSYGFTIAAGSNEIQRNILGERVLGLPKTK
ncbi:acyl-CoA dehydrogenase family protein [Paraliomyxa miuraensis]|uniref:acyl-CoA dehydrogenase family protein n=1 Tax=Paraliomyxa miuraensis TaxID=376150 RepID=UPI00224C9BB7|nr:acyl-CoA dehydrogenase family protein [Paraliomyxa miuraensis]MCX4245178.1 acyl-CoA dehydrogenase family protein [Paraliomyxa miuraensis]